MAFEIRTESRVVELSESELESIVAAAAWYAKYHQRIIVDDPDDRSARAVADREHHERVRTSLGKLGVPLAAPTFVRAAS